MRNQILNLQKISAQILLSFANLPHGFTYFYSQCRGDGPLLRHQLYRDHVPRVNQVSSMCYMLCYVLRIRIRDPGLGAFLTPGSGDPGWEKVSIRIRDPE